MESGNIYHQFTFIQVLDVLLIQMPQPTTQTKTPSTSSITKSEKLKYFISLSESSSSSATITTTTNKKENKQYVCDVVVVVYRANRRRNNQRRKAKKQRHSNKHAGSARL